MSTTPLAVRFAAAETAIARGMEPATAVRRYLMKPDQQSAPGQPIPEDMEPEEPKGAK